MTITSTGPSGFHLRPLVYVFAVAAIAAGTLAVVQLTGTDRPRSTPAPAAVSTEVVEPYASPSGSSEAFAAGKFDAGLVPEPSETPAASQPAPEIFVIEGQGSLYDALIEGKYDLDFSPEDPGVQYVLVREAATDAGGLSEAFSAGQLVEGFGDGLSVELPSAEPTTVAVSTRTISGGPQE